MFLVRCRAVPSINVCSTTHNCRDIDEPNELHEAYKILDIQVFNHFVAPAAEAQSKLRVDGSERNHYRRLAQVWLLYDEDISVNLGDGKPDRIPRAA